MSFWLLREYRANAEAIRQRREDHLLPAMECVPKARNLLKRHELHIPESTVDMLAHTILYVSSRKRHASPVPMIKKAYKHAKALLKYLQRPHPNAKGITYRWDSIQTALDNISVCVWLAVGPYAYDINPLLATMGPGGADSKALELLLAALEYEIKGNRTGRPPESTTIVIRGAMIVWIMARKEKGYWLNYENDALTGSLPSFIHDFFDTCNLTSPSDAAVHQRIVAFNKNCKTFVPVTPLN